MQQQPVGKIRRSFVRSDDQRCPLRRGYKQVRFGNYPSAFRLLCSQHAANEVVIPSPSFPSIARHRRHRHFLFTLERSVDLLVSTKPLSPVKMLILCPSGSLRFKFLPCNSPREAESLIRDASSTSVTYPWHLLLTWSKKHMIPVDQFGSTALLLRTPKVGPQRMHATWNQIPNAALLPIHHRL